MPIKAMMYLVLRRKTLLSNIKLSATSLLVVRMTIIEISLNLTQNLKDVLSCCNYIDHGTPIKAMMY